MELILTFITYKILLAVSLERENKMIDLLIVYNNINLDHLLSTGAREVWR